MDMQQVKDIRATLHDQAKTDVQAYAGEGEQFIHLLQVGVEMLLAAEMAQKHLEKPRSVMAVAALAVVKETIEDAYATAMVTMTQLAGFDDAKTKRLADAVRTVTTAHSNRAEAAAKRMVGKAPQDSSAPGVMVDAGGRSDN